jgi:hypothetical protein
MGAGLLVGAVLGGLGGAGIARGINRLTGSERARLSWPNEFLDGLASAAVLRYLAVAHYGRGRGRYAESEAPAFWFDEVQSALRARIETWHSLWNQARNGEASAVAGLHGELRTVTTEVLVRLYPTAARAFGRTVERHVQPALDTRLSG